MSNVCKFGYPEYDGFRYCGEHGGSVDPGAPPGTPCSRAVGAEEAK